MASRVYDASAFYAGIPFASPEIGLTTTLIYNEIKHIKKSHGVLDTLLETGRLKIIDADSSNVEFISMEAKKTGDFQKLSKADISALALSYQIDAILITDDFAVSNLAKNLKLKVQPIMTNGIRDIGKWIHYCSGCKMEFTVNEFCPNCGNKLNRKLFKR